MMGAPPTGGACGGGAPPSSPDGWPAGVATLSAASLRSSTPARRSVPASSAWLGRLVRRAAAAASAAAAPPGGTNRPRQWLRRWGRLYRNRCRRRGDAGCGNDADASSADVLSDAWGSTPARSRWWRRVASICGSSSGSDGVWRASVAYWARTGAAGRGDGRGDLKGIPAGVAPLPLPPRAPLPGTPPSRSPPTASFASFCPSADATMASSTERDRAVGRSSGAERTPSAAALAPHGNTARGGSDWASADAAAGVGRRGDAAGGVGRRSRHAGRLAPRWRGPQPIATAEADGTVGGGGGGGGRCDKRRQRRGRRAWRQPRAGVPDGRGG